MTRLLTAYLTALATIAVAALSPVAEAQCPPGTTCYRPQTAYRPVYAIPMQGPTAFQPMAVVASGEGSGHFLGWLNSCRASYGLSAVSYDPNLEAWGQQNNAQQAARGLGHYTMGPARRQNAAMGSYAAIGGMWMASGPHRAALLDPSIRFVGLAGAGMWWTFNAR